MVFFIWVGGGPRALAASVGIFLISLLFNGPLDDWVDHHRWSPEQDYFYQERTGSRTARRRGYQHRVQAGRTWTGALLLNVVTPTLAAVALLALVRPLTHCFPGLARHAAVRWVQRVSFWLEDSARRLADFVAEAMAQPQAADAQGSQPRERATTAEVQRLQTEIFVSEEELQRWSASRLKEELGRLQRLADMRMAFSGGSATRETRNLLRSGVAVEKPELVHVVLKARGGDSGSSCAVCLANYESGALLRLLPCGHRFHCECVDRWLVKQSRTCPLCSKRV